MAAERRPKRGATRGGSKPPRKIPVTAVFGMGFLAGVLTCILGWNIMQDDKDGPAVVKTEKTPRKEVRPKTEFEFYTTLPEREKFVPSDEAAPANGKVIKKLHSSILQAGSFRRLADADRMRAQLTLLGLEARVKSVTSRGDNWHRVLVGPFENRSTFARARSVLIDEGFSPLSVPYEG